MSPDATKKAMLMRVEESKIIENPVNAGVTGYACFKFNDGWVATTAKNYLPCVDVIYETPVSRGVWRYMHDTATLNDCILIKQALLEAIESGLVY